MNKIVRWMIVIALFVAVFAIAGGSLASRANIQKSSLAALNQEKSASFFTRSWGGSVEPPDWEVEITGPTGGVVGPRVYSIGGVATLTVNPLPPGVTINGSIYTGTLPAPANGKEVLSDPVLINITKDGSPTTLGPGDATISFAVPPGKTAKIHYFDTSVTPPVETILETTIVNGIATAPVIGSGVYVLVAE